MFIRRVKEKYKIEAIIPKEDFKSSPIKERFHEKFDPAKYKKVAPKLFDLFRKLNKGVLKKTVVMDFSGVPQKLKPIDLKLIEALKGYDYEVNEEMYKTGVVLKGSKQVPILDILKTKATKARALPKLKAEYEKNKNERVKKEIEFLDQIVSMKLVDSTQKIDIRKLAIYDNDKAKIVFTYDLRAIASQSTDVGWTSCMNLLKDDGGKGEEYKKVGAGASAGSFIAYLVKNGDEYTLNSPTARVLFKPYFNRDANDFMWKADNIHGTAPEGFREKAQKLIDHVHKPKQGHYKISKAVYVDDLDEEHFVAYDESHIDEAMKDKVNYWKRSAAMQHPLATEKHIDQALEDYSYGGYYVRRSAIRHPKATEKHIDKALEDPDSDVRRAAIKHPKSTVKHIDKALEDEKNYVRMAAIKHPKFNEKHIDKALEDKDWGVREAAIEHPKANEKHIDKAMEDEYWMVRRAAIEHPKATEKHIDKALEDKDIYVRRAAIEHPKATEKHIDKALEDKNNNVREAAIQHPKATEKHIDKAMDDEDWRVRQAAIKHTKANEKHIDKAMEDKDWRVRRSAIKHPKANEKHIDKALEDKDIYVRRAAIEHPKATVKHIDKALEDENKDVRREAIRHPNATVKHIDKALDDKEGSVRWVAEKKQERQT